MAVIQWASMPAILLQTLLYGSAAVVLRYVYAFVKHRRFTRRLQTMGLPMPPHHFLWGHILAMGKANQKFPPNAGNAVAMANVRKMYPELGPVFYLDLWPVAARFLVVTDPEITKQFTQTRSLQKFPEERFMFEPLAHGNDLATVEGQEWKYWRNLMNPAFAARNARSFIPDMVDDVEVFQGVLRNAAAKADIFQMQDLVGKLHLDIVGNLTLGVKFKSQTEPSEFIDALLDQLSWMYAVALPTHVVAAFHPFRSWYVWRNNQKMEKLLRPKIQERFAMKNLSSAKTVLEHIEPDSSNPKQLEAVSGHLKTMMAIGYDTTSSTMTYIFYCLSKNPTALRKVRLELDEVLGTDLTKAANTIRESPKVLNEMPWVSAIIKETLRLYTPGGTVRQGISGFDLVDAAGRLFPTEGCYVSDNPGVYHRDPQLWPRANEFLPERWLVAPGDELFPPAGAFRPFVAGPRNCIGQEFVQEELKIFLALTAREFDVKACYDEWDQMHGISPDKFTDFMGDRGYQILGSCHLDSPRERLPCRITVR